MKRPKLYMPEVFQGNLKKKDYFEGYYFKVVSQDLKETIVIIPGVSLGEDPHAFIQVVISNKNKSYYVRFDLAEFTYDEDKLLLKIGENLFTQSYLRLYLNVENTKICGMIWFDALQTVDKKWWRPGVMGPFSFVPFMTCYHGVVSMTHSLKGSLEIGGEVIKFSGGKGYIQKDWGTHFPKEYLWVQSNHFEEESLGIMLAVARIPFWKFTFNGVIACLTVNEKTRVFGTYTGARIKKLIVSEKDIYIFIKQRRECIELRIKKGKGQELLSPVKGDMEGAINECLDAQIDLTIYYKNRVITRQKTSVAALEITQDINSLIKE